MRRSGFASIFMILAVVVVAFVGGYFVFKSRTVAPQTKTDCAHELELTPDCVPVVESVESSTAPASGTPPTVDMSRWKTYVDASSGLAFAFPPLGSPIAIHNVSRPDLLASIDIGATVPGDNAERSVVSIIEWPNVSKKDLKSWFENNVDDASGTLLASGAFQERWLPNGLALVYVAPIPMSYQGDPVAEGYMIAPSRDRIYAIAQSQDGQLSDFGYPGSLVGETLVDILGTVHVVQVPVTRMSSVNNPTPAVDISNWKRYEMQNADISFRYPPDWTVSTDGTSTVVINSLSTQAAMNSGSLEVPDDITVSVFQDTPSSLQNFAKLYENGWFTGYVSTTAIGDDMLVVSDLGAKVPARPILNVFLRTPAGSCEQKIVVFSVFDVKSIEMRDKFDAMVRSTYDYVCGW